MPETQPRTIGRYEIEREVGRGMMGVVYEARDPALGRRIALKTIRLAFAVSEDERRSFETRFLTEARVAARLSHPGIVVVHDVGQDPATGTLYIALEFLEGRTLAEVMAEGKPIDWAQALEITKRVAAALHHAHAEGVIHRDIKPANIMVLSSGQPKIMDFGIAKVETGQLTATGQFFGTPLYMSPEQALGRRLDARSDLFSLGTLAYGLLTGQQAFGGTGVPRIIMRVVHEDPPPPTHVVRGLPPEVDYLIARALAKDPADRYPDGRAMAEDIEDVLAARPPRHKRSWAAPTSVEGTLVSRPGVHREDALGEPAARRGSATLDADSQPAKLVSPPEPLAAPRPAVLPPRRGIPWVVVATLTGLAAAAMVAAFLMGRAGRQGAAGAVTADAAAPPVTTVMPAESAAPPLTTLSATTESSGAERAQLAINFEHSLKYGKLRVWVDKTLAVEQNFDSRVTRQIGSLKLRKGGIARTIEITAGRHEVKVEVAWDDNVKTGRIWASFDPGSTRRLSARLGGGIGGLVSQDLSTRLGGSIGGLVKRDLDLAWE